ncbi:hypothetical protein CCMA1212_002646 [Trichoderma ghanense]|uniref:Uncharacterized protein n=1 Tax=Trichoderma ghanense TaxID=65468 RepID=A0ABY2HB39_9HYPO
MLGGRGGAGTREKRKSPRRGFVTGVLSYGTSGRRLALGRRRSKPSPRCGADLRSAPAVATLVHEERRSRAAATLVTDDGCAPGTLVLLLLCCRRCWCRLYPRDPGISSVALAYGLSGWIPRLKDDSFAALAMCTKKSSNMMHSTGATNLYLANENREIQACPSLAWKKKKDTQPNSGIVSKSGRERAVAPNGADCQCVQYRQVLRQSKIGGQLRADQ